jgi:hypothetical protein
MARVFFRIVPGRCEPTEAKHQTHAGCQIENSSEVEPHRHHRVQSTVLVYKIDPEIGDAVDFVNSKPDNRVTALATPELSALAAMSASCVHFPIGHKKYKQCGLCPACIFRRTALASAGIEEPDDAYRYDFLGPAERINDLPEKRLAYLKAVLLQVARLRDIENHDRLPPAFERHVIGTGIIQRGQPQKGVIELLARYRDEWTKIATVARDRGHAWARLLAPKRRATQGVIHASA